MAKIITCKFFVFFHKVGNWIQTLIYAESCNQEKHRLIPESAEKSRSFMSLLTNLILTEVPTDDLFTMDQQPLIYQYVSSVIGGGKVL